MVHARATENVFMAWLGMSDVMQINKSEPSRVGITIALTLDNAPTLDRAQKHAVGERGRVNNHVSMETWETSDVPLMKKSTQNYATTSHVHSLPAVKTLINVTPSVMAASRNVKRFAKMETLAMWAVQRANSFELELATIKNVAILRIVVIMAHAVKHVEVGCKHVLENAKAVSLEILAVIQVN